MRYSRTGRARQPTSRRTLVQQALAILAKYGSAANLYLPGVGAISGITAENWLDSVGGTPATVDGAVGTVVNARGGVNLVQGTPSNRPILRQSGGVYAWGFVSSDSLASTLTAGNAGFFCMSAKFNDGGIARTLIGAGAGSASESGVWLARNSINFLRLQLGDGSTLNTVSAAYPVATASIASAGWDSSSMFVGINNTEASGAKSVDCTSSNTMNIGVLTGTTLPMLGTIGATIIMPTVLPTATERATLRQFVSSLSGVTL